MKKIIFITLAVSTFSLGSCGGSNEATDEKKGPDLCTCVNEKWENDEEKEACKKMEEEYKEKFKTASEDEMKELMQEVEACQEK